MGAMVFGFLQRSSSLYGTGVGSVRCLGATADTAVRLNRVLSKHFCLAVADESLVKLTNFDDVSAIQQRLEGWDALVLGNDWTVTERPCTANTFERGPNDKTMEIYWDRLKSDTEQLPRENLQAKAQILDNVLQAAKLAGISHVVGVEHSSPSDEPSLRSRLASCGIPYTCIEPVGKIVSIPDHTYRKGVAGQLEIHSKSDDSDSSHQSSELQIAKEDIAALCVQSLQSLDWKTSRTLQVACSGPLQVSEPVIKRPDQEWCVESRQLEAALAILV